LTEIIQDVKISFMEILRMDETNIGEIVYLKSGSPKLTIVQITSGLDAVVGWFASSFDYKTATLALAALTKEPTPIGQ
jgi:uncharacterized protein YodC (DUF2158 family)